MGVLKPSSFSFTSTPPAQSSSGAGSCPYLRPSKLGGASTTTTATAASPTATTPVQESSKVVFVPLSKETNGTSSAEPVPAPSAAASAAPFLFGEKLEERVNVEATAPTTSEEPASPVATKRKHNSEDADENGSSSPNSSVAKGALETGEEEEKNVIQVGRFLGYVQ